VRPFLKRKFLFFWKLDVEYFYLFHKGPLLEFSSSHLNILPCFSKINFNNIIQSLVEASRSSSRWGRWGRAKGALKFSLPACYLLTFPRVVNTNLYPSLSFSQLTPFRMLNAYHFTPIFAISQLPQLVMFLVFSTYRPFLCTSGFIKVLAFKTL
jgi:hypothetical protein